MFANRFTALVDACSLVGALGRNTLLSLAEAELFRVRWSGEILVETERALSRVLARQEQAEPDKVAARQIARMRDAFPEAMIENYDAYFPDPAGLSDPNDAHVIAAARACGASVIVTENLRDFLVARLGPLPIEVKTSDDFVADAIDLEPARAVAAIEAMRRRFRKPEMNWAELMLRYESRGFFQTADLLRAHGPPPSLLLPVDDG